MYRTSTFPNLWFKTFFLQVAKITTPFFLLWTDLNATTQDINRSSDCDMIISGNFADVIKPFILTVINARASNLWSAIHGKHTATTESLPVQLLGFWCNVSTKCSFTDFTCHNFDIPDCFLVIIVNTNKTSLILVKIYYFDLLYYDDQLSTKWGKIHA